MDKASGTLPENHLLYAPGLKWRARAGSSDDVPIWVPPAKDIKAGYAPKSITLDKGDSHADIAAACRRQWADLEQWRADRGKTAPVRYTISWLIDRYQNDAMSPYHALGQDTKDSYGWECKRIRETIGERRLDPKVDGGALVPRILGEDIRRWFHNWGHPVGKPPTPSRATHCIAMLRTLVSYYVEIGGPGAAELRGRLSAMKFSKPGARTKAPGFEQLNAVVAKAEEMGFPSIAIATLAQYELIERRKHIIGQWAGKVWSKGWVWDGHVQIGNQSEWVGVTPDWRIRYFQTKKGANLREYDLKTVQRLLGLMQLTPKENRQGPIVVCETTGQPWEKRRYQEKFREIARAAGVPDDVWSMDMRSGGATEAADLPEVTPHMLQDGLGHADLQTQEIYRRNKPRNAQKVVDFRQAARDKK